MSIENSRDILQNSRTSRLIPLVPTDFQLPDRIVTRIQGLVIVIDFRDEVLFIFKFFLKKKNF